MKTKLLKRLACVASLAMALTSIGCTYNTTVVRPHDMDGSGAVSDGPTAGPYAPDQGPGPGSGPVAQPDPTPQPHEGDRRPLTPGGVETHTSPPAVILE